MVHVRRQALTREQAVAALRTEGLEVTEWTDAPGAVYNEHAHTSAEIRVVLEGGMTFTIDGADHTLGPGDRIDLPAGEEHAARVHAAGVRYLAATRRG